MSYFASFLSRSTAVTTPQVSQNFCSYLDSYSFISSLTPAAPQVLGHLVKLTGWAHSYVLNRAEQDSGLDFMYTDLARWPLLLLLLFLLLPLLLLLFLIALLGCNLLFSPGTGLSTRPARPSSISLHSDMRSIWILLLWLQLFMLLIWLQLILLLLLRLLFLLLLLFLLFRLLLLFLLFRLPLWLLLLQLQFNLPAQELTTTTKRLKVVQGLAWHSLVACGFNPLRVCLPGVVRSAGLYVL